MPDGRARNLDEFVEGVEYVVSPGGVSRMLRALATRLLSEARVERATWIALNAAGPPRLRSGGVDLRHARLDPDSLVDYGRAKERIWAALHGQASARSGRPDVADLDPFARAVAEEAGNVHRRSPVDLFYVHDFQLALLARHLPASVPRVLRWHVPVTHDAGRVRGLIPALDAYDLVIVSTRRYAEAARRLGVRAPVVARYPYVEPASLRRASPGAIEGFCGKWAIAPEDEVALVVARMDPMKGQDVAIRAVAALARARPRLKLVLVGNGSFSSARQGSLGLDKAARWRASLERGARELGVADRVVFTGHAGEDDLAAAYGRADVVLLPSRIEGFGLAVVEAWLHGKPAVVSDGAGVAELVDPGRNGWTFPAGSAEDLARALAEAFSSDLARVGKEGERTAALCHADAGIDGVWSLLETVRSLPRAPRSLSAPAEARPR